MHTRCPHCNTCFKITLEHLNLAQGAVRCGRCLKTFDGKAQLIDSPETTPTPAIEVETSTPTTKKSAAAPSQPAQKSTASTHEKTSTTTNNAPTSPPSQDKPKPVSERSEDLMAELDQQTVVQQHISPVKLLLGLSLSLILTLMLVLQYIYFNRDQLAQNIETRPWLEQMCQVTDCQLPLMRSPRQIKLISRKISTHPDHPNALLVQAEMHNEAGYTQAFPSLQLTLLDITGRTLSGRRFAAEEYIGPDIQIQQGIGAKETYLFALELVDPGTEAVGFEFEFH